MFCPVCEWLEKPWRIVHGHDQATCNRKGGDMEGYSLDECITEQRRLNDQYYQRAKRDWNDEKGESSDSLLVTFEVVNNSNLVPTSQHSSWILRGHLTQVEVK